MSTKLAMSQSPAATLITVFLCLHQRLRILAATDVDFLEIPANASRLNHWLSERLNAFRDLEALEGKLVWAERHRKVIRVRQDGSGDFATITAAVRSIPENNAARTIISIGPGLYNEKVFVNRSKPFVTFRGHRRRMPTIMFGDTAATKGTWDSATVAVESNDFVAYNIIFTNTAPRPRVGVIGAQAVAMRISGDKAAFYNCKFFGYQDTLLDDKGKHFFKDCFIRGSVDFIFGNGRSIYLNCEINSVAHGFGAITAQGRTNIPEFSGFSFVHCRVDGTGPTFLGRAWRPRARVVFAYTYMGVLVNPKGWDDKGLPDRDRTVFYGEHKCMGPGAATGRRVNYAKDLNDTQARPFLSLNFIHAQRWLLPPPKL